MIDADLELIATIGLVGRDLHATAAACSGHVLQQAHGDGIEARRRNLEVREDRAERSWRSAARNRCDGGGSRCAQAGTAARSKNIGDGRVGEIARESRIAKRVDDAICQARRGKVAVRDFGGRGHVDRLRQNSLYGTTPFIGTEEKRLVLANRAADACRQIDSGEIPVLAPERT